MKDDRHIQVPDNWHDIPTGSTPVDEGPWLVQVSRASVSDNRLQVQFEVRNKGPFHRRFLFRTYSTATEDSTAALKELFQAAGVAVEGAKLEHDDLVDRRLSVYVKHNEGRDGRVYANVVRHWPYKAQGQ